MFACSHICGVVDCLRCPLPSLPAITHRNPPTPPTPQVPPDAWLEGVLARACRLAADGRLRAGGRAPHHRLLSRARAALVARGRLSAGNARLFDLALGGEAPNSKQHG